MKYDVGNGPFIFTYNGKYWESTSSSTPSNPQLTIRLFNRTGQDTFNVTKVSPGGDAPYTICRTLTLYIAQTTTITTPFDVLKGILESCVGLIWLYEDITNGLGTGNVACWGYNPTLSHLPPSTPVKYTPGQGSDWRKVSQSLVQTLNLVMNCVQHDNDSLVHYLSQFEGLRRSLGSEFGREALIDSDELNELFAARARNEVPNQQSLGNAE